MAVKNIDYSFKRGDTQVLKKFKIVDAEGKEVIMGSTEQLYFTIKKNTRNANYILQKRIGQGIEKKEDGYYHITMLPSDTKDLKYGTYYYDIELKSLKTEEFVKTIIEGTITLEEEVTWGGNE